MQKLMQWLFYLAVGLVVYMPLHVLIVQSASLLTGGLEVWKAAKDVLIGLAIPLLLYVGYRRGLHQQSAYRWLLVLGGLYAGLHLVFVLFDQSDDTYSAIAGSVFNLRVLVYLLLGYIIGAAKNAQKYLKILMTVSVLIASAVALFGVLQYFLPHDLLESVGYTLERGVKPLFFIDDNPDLPRVMSTLKDPNSLGAFLILPILATGWSLYKNSVNQKLFIRPFRREALAVMLGLQLVALFLTFSRGALIGLVLAAISLAVLSKPSVMQRLVRKFGVAMVAMVVVLGVGGYALRDSAFVQDYILHASESTDVDPNQKRLNFAGDAIEDIADNPEGHGPGTAGLVAISNPQGGVLTENYYLQIAYEVGVVGLVIFGSILAMIVVWLFRQIRRGVNTEFTVTILASFVGYAFYSLLIHLWSNEAVALQWWLLCGVVIASKKRNTVT